MFWPLFCVPPLLQFTVPSVAGQIVDRAIQSFGAEGISQDQVLSYFWASLRTLRLADGPDEVHLAQIGKHEARREGAIRKLRAHVDRKEKELQGKARL